MPNYNNFLDLPSLKGKLKPITCKSCRDDGLSTGTCAKCLKNQAWNKEYLETHPFVFDTQFRTYHYYKHDDFKSLPIRLKNEHPYLYYGIELEIEFDQYLGQDDYDDYDECYSFDSDRDRILTKATEICPLFVYEADSSLDRGIEFISRPMSYAYMTAPKTIHMFKQLFEYLKSEGALANQPNGNGMHIHLSNKFFESGNTKLVDRREAYKGFDWLFTRFQKQIELLGGRKYTGYCQSKLDQIKYDGSVARLKSYYNADVKMEITIKKGGEVARGNHSCAITMSGATIEARVFKSTIDYKQMLANVELVRNFAHAVRNNAIDGVSLNEILHTKDNLYLDKHIQAVRMASAKNKEVLDLDDINTDTLSTKVEC